MRFTLFILNVLTTKCHFAVQVLAVGIDGSITFANMKMEQLLELELDDLIGINISSFIAPDSIEGYDNMIRRVMDSEGQQAFDEGTFDGESSANRSGSDSSNVSRSKGSDKSDCLNARVPAEC
jgi:PAS domain-containing protein